VYLSIMRADARRTEEIAMVTVGLLVTLEAKPGKEAELAAFVASALPLAQAEPETTAWFAIKVDASTFGIVDVFPDAAGRRAHLDGPIAAALMQHADELLVSPPDIKPIDVLAAKLPR
jgi:quinol monooxygenase YgiN